jgi:hypothetical protein
MSDPAPRGHEKIVRRIAARFEPELMAIAFDLRARNIEERAHQCRASSERPIRARAHAGDAVQARTSNDVHEDGLRLIVSIVADGDDVAAHFPRHPPEEVVAHHPRGLLNRLSLAPCASPNVSGGKLSLRSNEASQFPHVCGVGGGFFATAEAMIEVSGDDLDAKGFFETTQCRQESRRIRAT